MKQIAVLVVLVVLARIKKGNNMTKVKLDTIEKVKEFVKIVSNYNEEILVSCGKYIVDAKSILGVFSLNLSDDLSLSILTDDNKVRDKLHNDIQKFIVNKGE